jgi:hypothetical protein
MSDDSPPPPVAGKQFPWEHIAGACMRLENLMSFAALDGRRVGSPTLGAYGLAIMELPNPDVTRQQRLITFPVQTKGDYKSICRAQLDRGVQDGSVELVIAYEHRRGLFGGAKPGLHIAGYPAGTWQEFFEAVSNYKAQDFVWPAALFLYQPTGTRVFPSRANLFSE